MNQTDISAAAALMGRKGGTKGGKARSEIKTAAARKNGQKGGRRPVFFTSDTITPERIESAAAAAVSAAVNLRRIADGAGDGDMTTAQAAKLANAALCDLWRAAQGR